MPAEKYRLGARCLKRVSCKAGQGAISDTFLKRRIVQKMVEKAWPISVEQGSDEVILCLARAFVENRLIKDYREDAINPLRDIWNTTNTAIILDPSLPGSEAPSEEATPPPPPFPPLDPDPDPPPPPDFPVAVASAPCASSSTPNSASRHTSMYCATSVLTGAGTSLWYYSFVVTTAQPHADCAIDAETYGESASPACEMAATMVA
ncbi:hypothetical protein PG985_005643 [Apiospora marii]|uniref:uncharacterized protein n=1 Tax=Apiospora marii TaxID=335849 RepID=UPI0031316AC4